MKKDYALVVIVYISDRNLSAIIVLKYMHIFIMLKIWDSYGLQIVFSLE